MGRGQVPPPKKFTELIIFRQIKEILVGIKETSKEYM